MRKFCFLILFVSIYLYSKAQSNIFFNWDTIRFEHSYEFLKIVSSENNIWQIGTPAKNYFDSAYSVTNAIVTDTLNHYPINNHSYFDLYIGFFNFKMYPYSISLEINHKFETDTLKDGGYITVSYDNGNSWTNIIDDNEWCYSPTFKNQNLYAVNDTLFNGEHGFSGKSDGWITTWFSWEECLCSTKSASLIPDQNDTMIVRFNFISDDFETHKEGWMIDNIRLFSFQIIGATNDELLDRSIKLFQNPKNQCLTIDLRNVQGNKFETEIYSLNGTLVDHRKFNTNKIEIETMNLSQGVYFIKIKNKEGIVLKTDKFIKK